MTSIETRERAAGEVSAAPHAPLGSFDWARSSLGPVERWPQALRSAIDLIEHSKLPMCIAWGPELIQLHNEAFGRVLGKTKHPATGQSARETFSESWTVLEAMYERALRGEAIEPDVRLVPMRRKGFLEECHFSSSYSPIEGPDGGAGGVIVTLNELTDLVQSERSSRTFRMMCRLATVPESPAEIWRSAADALGHNPWDLPFVLLYELDESNDVARLVGSTAASGGSELAPERVELAGASDWPFAKLLAGASEAVRVNTDTAGAPWPTGAWLSPAERALVVPIRRSGRARPAGFFVAGISSGRELDDDYREFLHLVARQIGFALSHARSWSDEREQVENLESVAKAKSLFFSNVGYELRTPLTLVLGPVEDLLAGEFGQLGNSQAQQVRIIQQNALRLLKLVTNLLDFARVESGRVDPQYEALEIGSVTAAIAEVFRTSIERADLKLRVEYAEPDRVVRVDREIWEKVILNLVSNAFKFTSEGEIVVQLMADDVDHVTLEVRDTGVGIAVSEIDAIFRRFQSGRAAHELEGSGIGLAMVRELVRLHGGTISVKSELGRGSTFRVRIRTDGHSPTPRASGRRPPSRERAETAFAEEALRVVEQREGLRPQLWAAATIERVTAESAGARVLVVDDNPEMREYLGSLLSTRFEVETAPDLALALESVQRSVPDLVITDLMTPQLDGLELLRALRADPRTSDVPLLILSARADEEARIEGLSQGANDYLSKPFSARELIARANSQIALQRVRQAGKSNRSALYELFLQAPAPICVLRGDELRFEMANTSFLRAINHTDVLERPLLEAVPELRGQGIDTLLRRVLETGVPHYGPESSLRVRRAEPLRAEGHEDADELLEERKFSLVFAALRSASGRPARVMVFASDVTDQVRARTDLEDARSRAEAANRAKDEFMAMLGHELRNPLAPIATALELMHSDESKVFLKERTIIGHQVQHLIRLVDDLLDVSRITRGKLLLRKLPVEISSVVARAIELASPALEERHHRLSTQVPSTGLLVLGDQLRLVQVVANLLTNAAKYTSPGGEVQVRAWAEDDQVLVAVRDTGIGIGPELAPRIFDLFVQGARPQSGAAGLGLGLTLVRSLTQLHGGSVGVHSEGVGKGSEFLLRFPQIEPRAAAAERSDRPSVVAASSGPPGKPKPRVLIVDDNEDAAELLAEGLRRCGHDVRVAFEAPRGIDLAREFRPDVALLDLGLPVMDGYELARRLHELPEAATTRLIAVTGYGQDSDRKRSREAGFSRHLVKPVDLASVDQNIRQLVLATDERPAS